MSRGPYPILLMLAMSLPGAVRALGLGDIRVDSALNEPLSAQIDIVGATRDELAALTASVANREIFQRYGADRPSFLSTATFKVGIDAQGRAVLNVRSADAFTDPLVSFLVDLRWGKNEIVREYSLLLDPPNYRFPRPAAEAAEAAMASAAPAPVTPAATGMAVTASTAPAAPAAPGPATRAAAAAAPPAPPRGVAARAREPGIEPNDAGQTRVKVEAGDTLRGIARRAGAATETQAQTLMIAIFRANPEAFDGNINRLHRGAILTLPTAAGLAAMSSADARREVRAQMTAWRLEGRPAAAPRVAAGAGAAAAAGLASAGGPGTSPAPHAQPTPAKDEGAPDASLKSRVQSLEQQLDEMHQQLASENEKIQALKLVEAQQAAAAQPPPSAQSPAPAQPPVVAPAPAAAPTPTTAQAPLTAQAPAAAQAPVTAQAPSSAQSPNTTSGAPDNSAELVSAPIVARAHQNAAAPAAAAAPPTSSHAEFLGPVAVTLGVLIAGFAFVRRRLSQSRLPAGAGPEPMLAPMPEAMIMPTQTHPFDALPVTAYSEPMAPAEAFKPAPKPAPELPRPAESVYADTIEEPMPLASSQTTSNLEIDIEALERSYLESLPSEAALGNAAAHHDSEALEMALDDPALADTTTVETVESHDSDTGVLESDLNTVMMDVEALDRANHADAHPQELGQRDGLALARVPDAAVHSTALDFNLVDLDATVQHVQMATGLHEQPEVAERRMNIVDVLKAAIEKDPKRRDLRMKLLETYYSVASLNQRAFMDVVRKLSRERDLLTPDDWKKVTLMGREIAADDILFADLDPPKEGNDLADCA